MKRPHWLYKRSTRLLRGRRTELAQRVVVVVCALYILGQVLVACRYAIGGR